MGNNDIMRIIPCPIPGFTETLQDGRPVYFVELPERWLGEHEERRSATIAKLYGAGVTVEHWLRFAGSLAVVEDFNLPGVKKNSTDWDFSIIDLELMAWVNAVVWDDIMDCFNVKKKYYSRSLNGTKAQIGTSPDLTATA